VTDANIPNWRLQGEIALNCNCKVFCPCVVSLGEHPPTEGRCFAWAGIHLDKGNWGDLALDGLNVALLLDIPGRMADGGWSAAAYIDDRASPKQAEGLEKILSGAAGGHTGLFSLLVSDFLGVKRVPITYEVDGKVRRIQIPKILDGTIEPIKGVNSDEDVVIRNTRYWMSPDVTVAQAGKSKFKDFGRVWNLTGRSAELAAIDWSGPGR
jgi:hypothetical protein